MKLYDISKGKWQCEIDGKRYEMKLPGTLDENKIGSPDSGQNQWHPEENFKDTDGKPDPNAPISTRLTRKYTYTGVARISGQPFGDMQIDPEKRYFVEVDRARHLGLEIDGKSIPADEGSLSTPYVFEITGQFTTDSTLAFLSDNAYEGLPAENIIYSSAATDETQTNWNGLLGFIRIREEEPCYIQHVRIYAGLRTARAVVTLSLAEPRSGVVELGSDAFDHAYTTSYKAGAGVISIEVKDITILENAKRWDEYEGNLYDLCVSLKLDNDCGKAALQTSGDVDKIDQNGNSCESVLDEKHFTYGIREFGCDKTGRLTINGRRYFLRGEANCAEFPETGHMPTDVSSWMTILDKYKAYGINTMRFHSHTPPEAAFEAADRMGIMMEPELSHWNPNTAFESLEAVKYYHSELQQILYRLANHPSFVMLSFGNELNAGEEGFEQMRKLLRYASDYDNTRLYANASNTAYGEKGVEPLNGFYTAMSYYKDMLRATSPNMEGHLNHEYPTAQHNYSEACQKIRGEYLGPIYEFEVGQYEVLPDFDELDDFQGVTDPVNLKIIQKKVQDKGLESVWKKYVNATGEISLLCYREEVEACLRTPEMSGLSLLGLQDFPGQGTALVGMMNSHLNAKPFDFARPERFQTFFRSVLPQALLPKYTYNSGEKLTCSIVVPNYGKESFKGQISCILSSHGLSSDKIWQQDLGEDGQRSIDICQGEVNEVGMITIDLAEIADDHHTNHWYDLQIMVTDIDSGAEYTNQYSIWVYDNTVRTCPSDIYQTESLDEQALEILGKGGKVYLTPKADKEHQVESIKGQFSTDFWSVGTFPEQEGGMGQLINAKHPIFQNFPTEDHTDYQWWIMASQRAIIMPDVRDAIITEMDSYAKLRDMFQLAEFKCLGGKLMISSMDLPALTEYPEAVALQNSIYQYMSSDQFEPTHEIRIVDVKKAIH